MARERRPRTNVRTTLKGIEAGKRNGIRGMNRAQIEELNQRVQGNVQADGMRVNYLEMCGNKSEDYQRLHIYRELGYQITEEADFHRYKLSIPQDDYIGKVRKDVEDRAVHASFAKADVGRGVTADINEFGDTEFAVGTNEQAQAFLSGEGPSRLLGGAGVEAANEFAHL